MRTFSWRAPLPKVPKIKKSKKIVADNKISNKTNKTIIDVLEEIYKD